MKILKLICIIKLFYNIPLALFPPSPFIWYKEVEEESMKRSESMALLTERDGLLFLARIEALVIDVAG